MSFSMYTVDSVDDARHVAELGTVDLIINGSQCENCGMSIGPSLDEFFPCVVIHHETEDLAWPICLDCASPAIFPDEGPLTMEFESDVDFDLDGF